MYAQGWNAGYSAAGEVVEVGEGVDDFSVGDVVAAAGAGHANHADYICVPRNLVCRVPDGCSTPLAATATIGAIVMQAVRRSSVSIGECAAVIGLGLLGQILVRILLSAGCNVIAFDPKKERATAVSGLATVSVADTPEKFAALLDAKTGGHGADVTFLTAATTSDEPVNMGMRSTRRRGKVVIVGAVGLKIERADFYLRELDLLMSTSYGPGRYDRSYEIDGHDYPLAYVRWTLNRNMNAYLEMIAAGRICLDDIFLDTHPISQASSVYEGLINDNAPPLGVIFSYSEGQDSPSSRTQITGAKKPVGEAHTFALVGVGAFGVSMIVPRLRNHPKGFHLSAVVSSDPVRGGNYARQEGVGVIATSIRQVAEEEKMDAVVIASRHDQHATQVIEGLNAGLHVFVEKPLALNWQELERIVDSYQHRAKTPSLTVGFNRRHAPAVQILREVLDNRVEPIVIHYRLNGGRIPAEHWIQTKEGGGRNLGEACHFYDVFRSLTGAPVTSIAASGINPKETSLQRNDNFTATMTYADGSMATLTYVSVGPKTGLAKERMEVFCGNEAYLLDDYRSLTECSTGKILWRAEAADKGHDEEILRFGNLVATGGEPVVPFDEIVEASAIALTVEDLLHGRAEQVEKS